VADEPRAALVGREVLNAGDNAADAVSRLFRDVGHQRTPAHGARRIASSTVPRGQDRERVLISCRAAPAGVCGARRRADGRAVGALWHP
jgi:hypothetical protein